MTDIGYGATEAGPVGWAQAGAFARHHLRVIGGFVAAVLHDSATQPAQLELVAQQAAKLAASGGEVVVLAATLAQDGYDVAAELSDAQWRVLLAGIDLAADVARRAGLTLALHPHVGTAVERADDVERVLDGSSVGLCLDTGHLLIGGCDPLDLARSHAARISHVHLKDVDTAVAARVQSGELGYSDAVSDGLYVPLGAGGAHIGEVVASLERAGYGGWYVVEQDARLSSESHDTATLAARNRDAVVVLAHEAATHA
jgi:inosose dehydratase